MVFYATYGTLISLLTYILKCTLQNEINRPPYPPSKLNFVLNASCYLLWTIFMQIKLHVAF